MAGIAVMLTAFTADFRISFTVDDFEEGPSNIVATAFSSNILLVPSTNLFVTGVGDHRLLSFTPIPNALGESDIRVEFRDTGYSIVLTETNSYLIKSETNVQTTTYQFTFKAPPEIQLMFLGDGWAFQGKAGKTYQVMTRDDMNTDWQEVFGINATNDQLVIFRGQEYLNKPIHVREIQ